MRRLPVLLLVPLTGCLSYESFLAQKNAKDCEIEQACNPALSCDDRDTGVPDCDFDPGAARDCLNGSWVCDDFSPGFEQAIPPQICDAVCRASAN